MMLLASTLGSWTRTAIRTPGGWISSTTRSIRLPARSARALRLQILTVAIRPDLFARVRLVGGEDHDSVLIEDRAVGTDLSKQFVLALAGGNRIEYRLVELGPEINGLRVVKQGLAPGDIIVVNGLQHVRPGQTVAPTRVAMASNPAGLAQVAAAAACRDPKYCERARCRSPSAPAKETHQSCEGLVMRFSEFFISRPIFAGVLSTLIFLAGLIALPLLPISEYPEVVPPTVVVKASYPGANPKVIADTVASPLEQSINGVEGMMYQSSQATADGLMTLTITFALSTDIDKAQVQVQNRVAQALPKLPDVVQRLGVTTNKASPDLTMVVHLVSPDNRYDTLYLSNYALLRVKDELARLDGVGDVQVFGAGQYSMRIWLDPGKGRKPQSHRR